MTESDEEKALKMLMRLDPIIQKHLDKVVRDHGVTFAMCIITNVATALLATAVVVHEDNGMNTETFMTIALQSLRDKYRQSKSQIETHNLLDRLMKSVPGSHQNNGPTKH